MRFFRFRRSSTRERDKILGTKALRRLRRKERKLEDQRNYLSMIIEERVRAGNVEELKEACQELPQIVEKLVDIKKLLPRHSAASAQFLFSAWILEESFEICTSTKEEGMHFVAGIEVEDQLVATHNVICSYGERSFSNASLDHQATHNLAIRTHDSDHRLLSLFHSQPGNGKSATVPSALDVETQKLWEQNRQFISGVWSRDGYLRLFSHELEFSVEIIGNTLEKLDENTYRLKKKQEVEV